MNKKLYLGIPGVIGALLGLDRVAFENVGMKDKNRDGHRKLG